MLKTGTAARLYTEDCITRANKQKNAVAMCSGQLGHFLLKTTRHLVPNLLRASEAADNKKHGAACFDC